MKIVRTETKIFHCGECCWAEPKEKPGDWYCMKTKKDIPSLWEKEIPEWCPLEDK